MVSKLERISEGFFDNADKFIGLALFLVFLGFFTTIDVHILSLVSAEKHHRYVQRASVTDFQCLHHRVFGIVIFLYGENTNSFALQL